MLFVEDNDVSRELVRRIFQRMKQIKVDLAKDGQEALLLTERYAYHIIFMDLQMPIMDGFDVAREIRRREALLDSYTPVVAVTAYTGEEDRRRCREAGMDGFLSKPINTEDMMEMIRHYIPCLETFL